MLAGSGRSSQSKGQAYYVQDCAKIRRAFIEGLSILGPAVVDSIIGELENMGISLGNRCSGLGPIADGLRYMYGDEIAEMMLQRIFLKLDELHWEASKE